MSWLDRKAKTDYLIEALVTKSIDLEAKYKKHECDIAGIRNRLPRNHDSQLPIEVVCDYEKRLRTLQKDLNEQDKIGKQIQETQDVMGIQLRNLARKIESLKVGQEVLEGRMKALENKDQQITLVIKNETGDKAVEIRK